MGLTNYSLKKTGELESDEVKESKVVPTSSSLDKLVESIYNSVVYAQRKVETEHLSRLMSTYFDDDGNPITFKVNLPSNDGEVKEAAIPLLTLAPNSHLTISELEMKLKVDLGQFNDDENIKNNKLSAKIGTGDKTNLAKIRIKMTGANAPEGLARINDQLVKILPN
jgi:hypothetical protein